MTEYDDDSSLNAYSRFSLTNTPSAAALKPRSCRRLLQLDTHPIIIAFLRPPPSPLLRLLAVSLSKKIFGQFFFLSATDSCLKDEVPSTAVGAKRTILPPLPLPLSWKPNEEMMTCRLKGVERERNFARCQKLARAVADDKVPKKG